MNSNTSLAIFAVVAAMALLGAVATYVIIPADATSEGVGDQRNFGDCKKDKNRNACENAKDRGAFKD